MSEQMSHSVITDHQVERMMHLLNIDAETLFSMCRQDSPEDVNIIPGNGAIPFSMTKGIETMKEKIQQAVKEKMEPHMKGGKIVYYSSSMGRYKTRVPKSLLIPGKAAPHTAVSEEELWLRLYEYFFGTHTMTLQAFFDEWWKARSADANVAYTTTERDDQYWRKYIEGKPIASMKLHQITSRDIDELFKGILAGDFWVFKRRPGKQALRGNYDKEKYFKTHGGDECTMSVTRKEFNNVRGMLYILFDAAKDRKLVDTNVVEGMYVKGAARKKYVCKSPRRIKYTYKASDREKILRYCLLDAPKTSIYYLAIALFFCLDVRIGELKALKWSDIHSKGDKKDIHIHSAIAWRENPVTGKKTQAYMDYTKTKEDLDREQILTPVALYTLDRIAEFTGSPNDFIVLNNASHTISTKDFNNHLKLVCEKFDIPYLPSHKIRSAGISQFISAGADISTAANQSGHSGIDTTMRYYREIQEEADVEKYWGSVFNCSPELLVDLGIKQNNDLQGTTGNHL